MDIRNCIMTDKYERIQGAKLRIRNKTYPVYKGVNTIGRNKAAIINMKNLNVSQHQAVIIIIDETQHFISDLNSSNGTYLLDTKLAPFKLYELTNEMEIKFGDEVASYLKMPDLSTTVHLEMEVNEMTQNVTQNFYAATTQLMFDNSSINQTRLSSLPHTSNLNNDTLDIHEAATQVISYPSEVTNTNVEESDLIIETVNDDIHEAPTQVVVFAPEASSKASQGTSKNKTDEEDIHEMATQVVSFPPIEICNSGHKDIGKELFLPDADKNLHEIPTKDIEPGNSSKLSDGPINQDDDSFLNNQNGNNSNVAEDSIIEETVMEEREENIRTIENEATAGDSNDSVDFLTIHEQFDTEIAQVYDNVNKIDNMESQDIGQARRRPPRKLSSSEELLENQNVRKIYNSDSETDIDDADNVEKEKLTKSSSEAHTSQNIPHPKKRLLRKLSSSEDLSENQNGPKIYNSDSETDIDDAHNVEKEKLTKSNSDAHTSQNIRHPKKRLLRKLSSSEDLSKNQNGPKICNSDSETDIDDADNVGKEKLSKLSSEAHNKKAFNSDSETDMEDDLPKRDKKVPKRISSDSETDVEDEVLRQMNLTQEDIIKPKLLSKKTLFNSDSETEINDNKDQDIMLEAGEGADSDETEVLNDTDCIPPTQDAFANMFEYKNLKLSNWNHSQNLSSEESFKLGLTELMIEGENNQNISECVPKDDSNSVNQQNLNNFNTGDKDDLYIIPRQKINKEVEHVKQDEEITQKIVDEQKLILSTSDVITNIEKDADEDLYMMPTQKIDDRLVTTNVNDLSSIPSTSKKENSTEKEADEDLYMMATQKINDSEHEFKAPAKKFTFKKKAANLEGSLTNVFSNKEEEDPYLIDTQKINYTEDNNEDDIYMLPTQKLENNSENAQKTQENNDNDMENDLYMQPTQNLNIVGPTTSETKEHQSDDDLYMAPTQQINQNSINTLYMLETQKIESQSNPINAKTSSNKPVEKDDLYDLPTQPLSHTFESEGHEEPTVLGQVEIVVGARHLLVNQDSPRRKRMKKSDIENLKRTIESKEKINDAEILSEIDTFVNKPLKTHETEDNDRVETLSQIDAFVKKPFDNAPKYEGNVLKDQTKKLNSSETETSIREPSNIAVRKAKIYLPSKKTVSETVNQKEEEDIDRPETLSQIEAFIKKPLAMAHSKNMSKIEENPSCSIKRSEIQTDTRDTNKKHEHCTRTSKTRQSTKPPKEDPYLIQTQEINQDFVNKQTGSKLNDCLKTTELVVATRELSNIYMLETQKIDYQFDMFETENTHQSSKRPSPPHEESITSTKNKRLKCDTENLKKSSDCKDLDDIDRSETLSQIDAFIKKPLDVEAPKSRKLPKIQEMPSVSSDDTKDNVKQCGKLKDIDELEKPENLNRASTRQCSKLFSEERKQMVDKTSVKSNSTCLTKPQESNGTSAEESVVDFDRDVSTSSSNSDVVRSDIDQSFALLEAKSTKTRKSSRITNVGEIKVSACKNRRTMTTSSIPNYSKNEFIDLTSKTRQSRKVTMNNEIINNKDVTISDSKVVTTKRKTDNPDSDVSAFEPIKKLKASEVRRGKRKASVADDIDTAPPTKKENNVEVQSKAPKVNDMRNLKGKGSLADEIDRICTASEDSNREITSKSTRGSVKIKGKGKATIADDIDKLSINSEESIDEPAKMSRVNLATRSKRKASIGHEMDKTSTTSEDSTKEISSKFIRASVATRGKGKATVTDDIDKPSTNSEESIDGPSKTPRVSMARRDKRKASVADEIDKTSTTSEDSNKEISSKSTRGSVAIKGRGKATGADDNKLSTNSEENIYVPSKISRDSLATRGKGKATVVNDIDKPSTNSEESIAVPSKLTRANVARKGKEKTTAADDLNKASITSGESIRDISSKTPKTGGKGKANAISINAPSASNENNREITSKTPRASIARRGKPIIAEDIDNNFTTSEDSNREVVSKTPKANMARKGKGKSTVKDDIDVMSTASEERDRGEEPATPSRGRANSRLTSIKSCGSAVESSIVTPRRGRNNIPNDAFLSSPERMKRKQRPKVVFTMMDDPQLESLIRQLGGTVVDNVDASTVLVTEHVKRSQKLLTAVGQGKPVCSPSWIRASKKANEFLDPWEFILTDKEAESKWDFSLKESITKAASEKLLANYSFQVLVSTATDVLKGAIESCGGKCVTRNPPKNAEGFFVVVASPENRTKYLKTKKQNPDVIVVESEAIFDGVLRQDLRLGRHLLT